ncbi:transcription factor IIIA [Tetranychus urticae]|uniref:C2H2-type domain-containing protein n=1 Tax=Tetranychus urticae TaxID=32264 RepID=T1L1B9_TETUR|nr:transcription factor IIIA [Tetranychus urticae]
MCIIVSMIVNMAQPKLFHCSFDECGASFPSAFRLQRHIRAHKGERPFICDIEGCDKSFTCRSYLNKHKKRPHNVEEDFTTTKKREKRYNCESCFKEFKDKFLWKIHLAHHTGEKPFKCDRCDAAFALKSRLIRHSARHSGFRCNQEDCDVVAETWNELRKHVATAHKKTNECHICGKIFTQKSNLLAHIDAHKFKCPADGCDKSFVRKGQLREHVEDVHLENYACDYPDCGRKFTDPITLAQHNNKHSSNPEKSSEKRKKPIFPYRKSLAQELSGFDVNEDELASIINRDKEFRKEMV